MNLSKTELLPKPRVTHRTVTSPFYIFYTLYMIIYIFYTLYMIRIITYNVLKYTRGLVMFR